MMSFARTWRSSLLLLAALLVLVPLAGAGEIHRAAAEGDAVRVAELLESDPALASQPDENPTRDLPLHAAAVGGHMEIARLLLEAGADVDGGDTDESTPLDVAALRGQREMCAFLLERGASLNHRDKHGACPISFAVFGGDSATTRLFLDAGADLNYRSDAGVTLVHAASFRGFDWLLDLLVERGHDVAEPNLAGQAAIHWAARGNQAATVERLIALGASPTVADTAGRTPLQMTMDRGAVDAARVLLAHGADPNALDAQGETCLLLSSWREQQELAELLIEHGADVNRPGRDDKTPLWWATLTGSSEMVSALLAAGAGTEAPDAKAGRTPLHLACLRGYTDVAGMLLDHGASMAARDRHGDQPLSLAVRHGNAETADLLVSRGARSTEEPVPPCLSPAGTLAANEAMVWYLGHSGWAIQTAEHFLVVDYHEMNRAPDQPGLANGWINPGELAGRKVMVLSSHAHGDHFNPVILGWQEELDDLTYVFGFRPEETGRTDLPEEMPGYELVEPRATRTIDGVTITAIESNDSGVGFWIEVDGLTVFHPGDHANRLRDFSGPFKAEIDFLAAPGQRPDLLFLPISGCGFGDLEAVKMGNYYVLETLEPAVFLPMHGGNQGWRYGEFIEACGDRFPRTQMPAIEDRGDCFHYKDGRAS